MLHEDDRPAVADVKLGAVVTNADAEGEAESGCEPVDGVGEIRVGELRDNSASRHGTVGKHSCGLRLMAAMIAVQFAEEKEFVYGVPCRGTL